MKQPLGEQLQKVCVLERVGCKSDPRRDYPEGSGPRARDRARFRPPGTDGTHPSRKQTWEGPEGYKPSHFVLGALMNHQLSPSNPSLTFLLTEFPALEGSLLST
jgi:hypothetical protein